jgi:hypothetical protein
MTLSYIKSSLYHTEAIKNNDKLETERYFGAGKSGRLSQGISTRMIWTNRIWIIPNPQFMGLAVDDDVNRRTCILLGVLPVVSPPAFLLLTSFVGNNW